MSNIINTKTNEVLLDDTNLCAYGAVLQYFEQNNIDYNEYQSLSKLVKTMTGDAVTPFDTLAEMIECIPDIVDCGEETYILQVFSNEIYFFTLGFDYEDNERLCTKILQTVCENPALQAIECC